MKLNALDRVRFVPDAHDEAVFGFSRDLQAIGHRFAFDDERVVTGGREWARDISEHAELSV